MTDSRKERKEDMTDHWWNIHTKICSLKAETENEKETHIHWSRSLRARGLKHNYVIYSWRMADVALFTGAWIETCLLLLVLLLSPCRALYGRVD